MSNNLIFILAPITAWFVAHCIKFALTLISSKGQERDIKIFVRAGGMPSSHTAVMIATLTVIAGVEGWDSALFGLGAAITAIIIYDSVNVRRAVGEQGGVLLKLLLKAKSTETFFAAKGHTVPEVAGGFCVGISVGIALLQIL